MKSLIAAVSLFFVSALRATEPGVSIYPLVGSVYVLEDSHFAKTNYGVYIGAESVTVIGAGWSPDVAELLAQEIRKVTDKPIKDVIVPDHDPEYAGGTVYWKRIGANVVSTTLTEEMLKKEWTNAKDFTRKHFPTYPDLPLALPTNTYEGRFHSGEWRCSRILPWAFTQHRRYLRLLSKRESPLRRLDSEGTSWESRLGQSRRISKDTAKTSAATSGHR